MQPNNNNNNNNNKIGNKVKQFKYKIYKFMSITTIITILINKNKILL